jgi:hypothetical protein
MSVDEYERKRPEQLDAFTDISTASVTGDATQAGG